MFWSKSKPGPTISKAPLPRRPLGKTGREVTLFGLGGEGVLRTFGREKEAVPVIQRALEQGVNYFDTAPAYSGSMDYYGAVLGELGGRRGDIFLACKTHDRTRDGSLNLLDDCLKRLQTDYLDLWQLHDLRTHDDLNQVFARGGALEALLKAREEGRVRYLGLTGHHDPAILLEGIRRFSFDTLLVAVNAADVHRLSFLESVIPEASRQQMGIIAMKVTAQGRLLKRAKLTMEEALGYSLSQTGVSLAIVGCQTTGEVNENADLARRFAFLSEEKMRALELRTKTQAEIIAYFKKSG